MNNYTKKYISHLPLFWHLFCGFLIFVLIKSYFFKYDNFEDMELMFWLEIIILTPYLLTLSRVLLKKDFIIEIKECEDELQINYLDGDIKIKSIVCKYYDIIDWGTKVVDTGIGRFPRAYIKDKFNTYDIVLGYLPDLRSFEPYVAFDIVQDIDHIMKDKKIKDNDN
jgi:hypothetical protein